MSSSAFRSLILFGCTASAVVVLGRAPAAVNLRLREIEVAIAADGKSTRDRKAAIRPIGNASV